MKNSTNSSDVIIATHGRLINMLKLIDWKKCTFLVIDEANRIFDSGFLHQLRLIIDYIRPDRQILLFGATLPPQIEEISEKSLKYSTRIQIGKISEPQANIDHQFDFCGDQLLKR